jgi:hypothetical protein
MRACFSCNAPIAVGTRMMQVARGRYDASAETPTYLGRADDSVGAEWHLDCRPADFIRTSTFPYACDQCGRSVADGDTILYAITGHLPDLEYFRPERRDRGLNWIVHEECSSDWLDRHPEALA